VKAQPEFEVVTLAGELDIARKEELHRALLVEPAMRGVLLDLSEVTYADSTALTELLRFRMSAEQDRIPVAIVVISPQLDRIIRYAGLHEVFDVFKNRADALAYLDRTHNGERPV
jgi:anti-sigma B factor antagonist